MTIAYEKTECGRCGGTGRYSFNSVDGSRCYGCGGSGEKLTKRGAAAKEFANSLLDVKIEDVPQDRQAIYRDSLTGRRIRFTGTVEGEPQAWKVLPNGEHKPIRSFVLLVNGEESQQSLGEGIRVRLVPTQADADAIMAYQASLTKAGKPRQR